MIFLQTHEHIFEKQVINDGKVFKMQRYNSITLHVSPKTSILEGSKKRTSTKIQNLAQKNFLTDLILKLLNQFVFESLAWKIISNWLFQTNVGFDLERAVISIWSLVFSKTIWLYQIIDFLMNKLHQDQNIWGRLYLGILGALGA